MLAVEIKGGIGELRRKIRRSVTNQVPAQELAPLCDGVRSELLCNSLLVSRLGDVDDHRPVQFQCSVVVHCERLQSVARRIA